MKKFLMVMMQILFWVVFAPLALIFCVLRELTKSKNLYAYGRYGYKTRRKRR